MLQQFTHAELESFNRTQLWSLCRERGLKCYPKTADCVEAIWNKQQSVEKVAVAEIKVDSQAVAQKELEAYITSQAETVAPEITTVEITFYDHEVYAQGKQIASITHDMDDFATQRWVVMVGETEVHRADSWAKCFEYVRWHYKQGTLPAALPIAEQLESAKHVQNQVDQTAPEIEIDSDIDADFGTLYRVWNSRTLLGTFYCAADNKWVAQPCNSNDRPRCNTPAEAQLLIVALAGLLVADSTDETDVLDLDALLDKPFDELTPDDWKRLKQQEFLEPIAA